MSRSLWDFRMKNHDIFSMNQTGTQSVSQSWGSSQWIEVVGNSECEADMDNVLWQLHLPDFDFEPSSAKYNQRFKDTVLH